jgi:DNA-binding GntR family transcriptional regulator
MHDHCLCECRLSWEAEHSNRQHIAIIDAVLSRDVLTAVEVRSEHIEATAALLPAFLG